MCECGGTGQVLGAFRPAASTRLPLMNETPWSDLKWGTQEDGGGGAGSVRTGEHTDL